MNNKLKQKELRNKVAPFATSDRKKSMIQLMNTIPPFFLLWFLAYQSQSISMWLTVFLAVITGGFVVRIFIIFHDCAHQSFFSSKKANQIWGTITGIITHFPFEKWKKEHAIHHATSGNLDKRGTGDIWVMTVNEYMAASFWKKVKYRLYRNPFVMFGLGPFFLFFIDNRINRKKATKKERWNTYFINVTIVLIYTIVISVIGWQAFLLIQLPILFVAGSVGIWLFYVQHQFEDSYYENEEEWNYVKAAVDGSSYYKLPKILEWLTGSIGYHHVHHLSPRVPNYRLEDAHHSNKPLQEATTITIRTSLESVRFRLYDEAAQTFVGFKDLKKQHVKKSATGVTLNNNTTT